MLRPNAVSAAVDAELLVVMPVYNEEANIDNVIEEWMQTLSGLDISSQMLLLNDGSKDRTLERMAFLQEQWGDRLIVVDKLNAGHGATCRFGYEIAARSECKWVLQIDSDGQCDARYLPDFWMQRNNCDVVMGLRVRRGDGLLRMNISRICRWLSSLVIGLNVPDPNVPYRLIRRDVLRECIRCVPSNFNIHNVALSCVMYHQQDIRISRVPIDFRARSGGENSLDVPKVMSWGAAMIFELLQLKRSLKE
jgi:glycosyltransferase involved in cell wall biosynthesis